MHGIIGILTGKGPGCDELQHWLRHEPGEFDVIMKPGNQIAWQRNQICRDLGSADYLFFIDNDCIPPAGALGRLLSHDVDIVAGAVLERVLPFDICAVKALEPYRRYTAMDLVEPGMPELIPVVAAGTGCMLIRRRVIRRMVKPYFRCGEISADLISEDLGFCLRAAESGFATYLDRTVKVGHKTDVILWPGDDGQHWAQWLDHEGRAAYRMPLGLGADRELHV